MHARSRPVSSMTGPRWFGPCVVAARTAPAPSRASGPGVTPGQAEDQA